MSCILSFNSEIISQELGENGSNSLTAKFTIKKRNDGGTINEEINDVTYTDFDGISPQTKFSNAIIAFWQDNNYCSPELLMPEIAEDEENTILGLMKQKNALLKQQNDLLKAGNESNAVSKAIDSQTQIQNLHGAYATEKNIAMSNELYFNKNGHSGLKDSNDNLIKPRDEKAKHNAEKAIETKAMNITDFGQEVLEFLGEEFENPFTDLINMAKDLSNDVSKSTFNYTEAKV